MRVEGVVVRVEAAQAVVQVRRQGGCGRCTEPGGCGGGSEGGCSEYWLDNPARARAGQRVLVDLPEGQAARAALLAYATPLLVLLLAAGGATLSGWPDPVVAMVALAGLVLSLLGLRLARHMGWLRLARPCIAQVIS
ncbi:MAG: Fis family transcriptional regulator [Candidatus Dactylopiibacterium carminicum]|uniref:Fis family transcriptional regulator n=1 Tax=Candidatus Dactylopiibacterium carminicum TaxID=857335 RepID=A0A272ETR7_9RHOO|nr:SoxR reducing system RseC family protein [Candidatus Dactylopiibacterium carminicum]KAF7599089.1 Fis family transcriptional regulator [Candidatus Dactylopiibacterium carminicum]PAS93150.1 MAG: Fis family transcriptional regulator [Candidatus Dactylopiibacterium carminicum]PAS96878.1 MAG: Fis family transcriptional regulator [Candidatus Dactylopiibacterium carminicum]PAS99103.1 MAG: hypothetical protein BSR46_09715 [Candidatus Dactylopiibacterium carminicum]